MEHNGAEDRERSGIDGLEKIEDVKRVSGDDGARRKYETGENVRGLREGLLGRPHDAGLEYGLLEAYVDGTADDATREIVESHMEADEALTQEIEELRALRGQIELGGNERLEPNPSGGRGPNLAIWLIGTLGTVGATAVALVILAGNPQGARVDSLHAEIVRQRPPTPAGAVLLP